MSMQSFEINKQVSNDQIIFGYIMGRPSFLQKSVMQEKLKEKEEDKLQPGG